MRLRINFLIICIFNILTYFRNIISVNRSKKQYLPWLHSMSKLYRFESEKQHFAHDAWGPNGKSEVK